MVKQLNINIGVLMRANVAFQEFANLADALAAQKERERITREIHDSSGYVFTNLIALMEVAISLGDHDLDRLTDVHYQAKRLAQEGLQETRRSLRRLRATEEDRPKGIKALLKVLRTFEQVTNIKINPTLGNIRWTYGQFVDYAIYRIVQEALTNSFRHGNARTIWISFWEQKGSLTINIKDDGKGAEKIEKGIGLAGMEERLGQIGGTLEIPEYRDGFQLLIRVPVGDTVNGGREDTGPTR
jgi:signal transduction histidine kinase